MQALIFSRRNLQMTTVANNQQISNDESMKPNAWLKVPPDVWGIAVQKLPINERVRFLQVSKFFRKEDFIKATFKGDEKLVISKVLQQIDRHRVKPNANVLLNALSKVRGRVYISGGSKFEDIFNTRLQSGQKCEAVIIRDVRLSPQFLQQLGSLKNLQQLKLKHVNITKSDLPLLKATLQNLTELHTIYLSDVHVVSESFLLSFADVGNIISIFDVLPATIQTITADGCNLRKRDLEVFSRFTALSTLSVNNNGPFESESLSRIPKSIKHLEMSDCYITDDNLPFLSNLVTLQTLRLDKNKLLARNLNTLPISLRVLSVAANALGHVGPMQRLTALQCLNISINRVNNQSLSVLPSSLTTLIASECFIDDIGVLSLRHLTNLSLLDLRINHIQGDTLQELNPAIKHILLDHNSINRTNRWKIEELKNSGKLAQKRPRVIELLEQLSELSLERSIE